MFIFYDVISWLSKAFFVCVLPLRAEHRMAFVFQLQLTLSWCCVITFKENHFGLADLQINALKYSLDMWLFHIYIGGFSECSHYFLSILYI